MYANPLFYVFEKHLRSDFPHTYLNKESRKAYLIACNIEHARVLNSQPEFKLHEAHLTLDKWFTPHNANLSSAHLTLQYQKKAGEHVQVLTVHAYFTLSGKHIQTQAKIETEIKNTFEVIESISIELSSSDLKRIEQEAAAAGQILEKILNTQMTRQTTLNHGMVILDKKMSEVLQKKHHLNQYLEHCHHYLELLNQFDCYCYSPDPRRKLIVQHMAFIENLQTSLLNPIVDEDKQDVDAEETQTSTSTADLTARKRKGKEKAKNNDERLIQSFKQKLNKLASCYEDTLQDMNRFIDGYLLQKEMNLLSLGVTRKEQEWLDSKEMAFLKKYERHFSFENTQEILLLVIKQGHLKALQIFLESPLSFFHNQVFDFSFMSKLITKTNAPAHQEHVKSSIEHLYLNSEIFRCALHFFMNSLCVFSEENGQEAFRASYFVFAAMHDHFTFAEFLLKNGYNPDQLINRLGQQCGAHVLPPLLILPYYDTVPARFFKLLLDYGAKETTKIEPLMSQKEMMASLKTQILPGFRTAIRNQNERARKLQTDDSFKDLEKEGFFNEPSVLVHLVKLYMQNPKQQYFEQIKMLIPHASWRSLFLALGRIAQHGLYFLRVIPALGCGNPFDSVAIFVCPEKKNLDTMITAVSDRFDPEVNPKSYLHYPTFIYPLKDAIDPKVRNVLLSLVLQLRQGLKTYSEPNKNQLLITLFEEMFAAGNVAATLEALQQKVFVPAFIYYQACLFCLGTVLTSIEPHRIPEIVQYFERVYGAFSAYAHQKGRGEATEEAYNTQLELLKGAADFYRESQGLNNVTYDSTDAVLKESPRLTFNILTVEDLQCPPISPVSTADASSTQDAGTSTSPQKELQPY